MKQYTAKQIRESISYYRKNALKFGGRARVEEACRVWRQRLIEANSSNGNIVNPPNNTIIQRAYTAVEKAVFQTLTADGINE